METGQGGRLDAVNIASHKSKLAILTKIGLDHIDILGDTLKSVATEKSAIIYPANIVISIHQRPSAERIVKSYAKMQGMVANMIYPKKNYRNIKSAHREISFSLTYKELEYKNIVLSLQGVYRRECESR
jgi:dihydrofolate synthase/folylpolyglutamate synthase